MNRAEARLSKNPTTENLRDDKPYFAFLEMSNHGGGHLFCLKVAHFSTFSVTGVEFGAS